MQLGKLSRVPQSSPNWTLYVPTTNFQSPFQMSFQQFIDQALHGVPADCGYIDDILIARLASEQHLGTYEPCWKTSLTQHYCNPDKCLLRVHCLDFLVHPLTGTISPALQESLDPLVTYLNLSLNASCISLLQ